MPDLSLETRVQLLEQNIRTLIEKVNQIENNLSIFANSYVTKTQWKQLDTIREEQFNAAVQSIQTNPAFSELVNAIDHLRSELQILQQAVVSKAQWSQMNTIIMQKLEELETIINNLANT